MGAYLGFDSLDKAITWAWSRSVARGGHGTPGEVLVILREDEIIVDFDDVRRRLDGLRSRNQIPADVAVPL